MLAYESRKSHIYITNEIQAHAFKLQEILKPNRVVHFIEDNFKIEHAKAVVAEAYISESQTKYIILGANEFTLVAQNSLLKVLEEPPSNIEFIIISSTKSNLLPTIRSRLPIIKGESLKSVVAIDLDLSKINYAEVFAFLKENSRIAKSDAKKLVEAIYFKATLTQKLMLTSVQLDVFDKAYRLLELNSRPQSVLAFVLMSFTR